MDVIQSVLKEYPSCCKTATAHDAVLNSECCVTFYTPYHEGGILVNLQTFLGTIPELAMKLTTSGGGDHEKALFVRICKQRVEKPLEEQAAKAAEQQPTKLAIGVEGGFSTTPDADKYDIVSTYSVVVMSKQNDNNQILAEVPYSEDNKNDFPMAVANAVDAIIVHAGLTTQQQVETWQLDTDEPVPVSKFANGNLPFVDNGVKIDPSPSSWKCEKTGATENLWLNLSDGYIGGGRKHWDGSGGSNGALDHFNETGQQYPLVVKLGTITSDLNTADCYSYDPSEDGPVKIPNLEELLHKRGIHIGSMQKTVKSTAELEVELNANYAFDAITEAGAELQPVSGPNLQGLQNLGNSCYMNSVVQSLVAIPELQKRYGVSGAAATTTTTTRDQIVHHPLLEKILATTSAQAAPTDVLLQTTKVATALTSGLFAKPKSEIGENDTNHPMYRLAPRMLKHTIGKDHVDFRTGQQQDAAQFFQYILEKIDQAEASASLAPVTSHLFSFKTTTRLECNADHKVKYKQDAIETVWSLRVPMEKATITSEENSTTATTTSISSNILPDQKRLKAENDSSDADNNNNEKKPVPTIELQTCLEEWAADTNVDGMRWTHLERTTTATTTTTQTTRLSNFPRYLMIQIQRYQLGPDWQPIKLEVNLQVPDDLDLTNFKSLGPQDGEDLLPEEEDNENTKASTTASSASAKPVIDEAALSQLMDMGFSLNSCKRALNAVGGSNVEAAMGWVFEHNMDPDFNDPLPEDDGDGSATALGGAAGDDDTVDEGVVMSLVDSLGAFTADQVRVALKESNGAADRAADWLFSHMDDMDAAIAAVNAKQQQNPVDVPQIPLEDGEGKYTLLGMISHIGKNTGSGHYVAHLKKKIDNEWKWVIFNDEKVALSSHPPKEHAYLYLFQRTDTIGSPHPDY